MKGWIMFNKIKTLKEQNLKITQIARILNSDVRTIKKYWNMSSEEFELLRTQYKQRIVGRKMDIYEQLILSWLKEFNDISGAQVFDWLKEREQDFSMAERTVRSYVEKLRKKYELPKLKVSRQFLAVPETDTGEQPQVDMGQINLLTEDKKTKKLHLFTMVLSFSRYKFAIWQDKPFTSSDIVQCHHKAFEFFGGVPKTIVYDQDKTMFVTENLGDIIKTDLFQKYINTMNFKVHLCRAFDPQSKGKIEAVVKFVKNNFAKHRVFTNIDDFNELCLDWLKRTGNAKEHSIIKKVPEEMYHLEKEHLQQVPPFLFEKEESTNNIVTYSLSKDNTVTYKSNRYQLPKETYSDKQKEVGVVCEDNRITFFNLKTKESINTYEISKDKGKLISNISRNTTPNSKVLELKSKILNRYSHKNLIVQYIENIEILKKRYIKSQFKRIDSLSAEYDKEIFLDAIKECISKDNFDLDFLAKLLSNTKKNTESEPSLQNIPDKLKNIVTETRELSEYEEKLVKLC